MGVRRYLNKAVGELVSARRRAELKHHSSDVIYDMEVLIRAVSRVKDQIKKENHDKEKIRIEEEAKALEKARKAYARAKRKKAAAKGKQAAKRRTRKVAA